MQNKTPEGGQRGRVLVRSGGMVLLATGTERREWKREKELPWGPKGWKGVIWVSEWKMEVPFAVWPVTTRRGGGRDVVLAIFVAGEDLVWRKLIDSNMSALTYADFVLFWQA